MITLSGTRTHENKKRLKDEFYQEDDEEDVLRLKKPGKIMKVILNTIVHTPYNSLSLDDYLQTFKGNIDDCFKIGMRYQNKSVFKLFSDFYTSDILVASPLGLRMIIGSAGDKNREFDFLSSIECCIVDQCDVLMMQNWDHVEVNIHYRNDYGFPFFFLLFFSSLTIIPSFSLSTSLIISILFQRTHMAVIFLESSHINWNLEQSTYVKIFSFPASLSPK